MRHKKKIFILFAIIIVVIGIYIIISNNNVNKDVYSFKGDKFYYSQFRGKPVYDMVFSEKNGSLNLYNISFSSRNFMNETTRIYGLLYLPESDKKVPGVVLLPGGGGTKENEWRLATLIANLGYAVLTIDQRGIGETGGYYINYEDDEKIFSTGREPMQHLAVYDVLRSYDVLKNIKGVDRNNIIVAGESMGARYAIIAAAIDKSLKGAMIISSSGFHFDKNDPKVTSYLLSIDPDNYISSIKPNPVVFFHGANDTMVSLLDARTTFRKANEPKNFTFYNNCGHGYCTDMDTNIKSSLKEIFFKG